MPRTKRRSRNSTSRSTPRPSLTERLTDWLDEQLYRLVLEGSITTRRLVHRDGAADPGAVAVVVAVRVARRTLRTNRGGDYRLFGAAELSAAEHRATARTVRSRRELGRGHPAPAAGRRASPRGNRRAHPGSRSHRRRTRPRRGAELPNLASEFASAATAFNDVTYGELPGTRPPISWSPISTTAYGPAPSQSRPRPRQPAGTTVGPKFGDAHRQPSVRPPAAVGAGAVGGAGTGRHRRGRHADGLADRAPARWSDGSDGHLSRRSPTPWLRSFATTASTSWSPAPPTMPNEPPAPTPCSWSPQTPYLIDDDLLRTAGRSPRRPTAGGTDVAHPGGAGPGGPRSPAREPSAASRTATCAKRNERER